MAPANACAMPQDFYWKYGKALLDGFRVHQEHLQISIKTLLRARTVRFALCVQQAIFWVIVLCDPAED